MEKTQLINEIIGELYDSVSPEIISKVKNILYIKFNNYDIVKKSTEIVSLEDTDSSSALVRKFFATKRLEGMSEKSIGLYYPYINKLLLGLNKHVSEITTYDIRFFLAPYKEKRNVKNITLDNMRKCYSSFFGWLSDEGFINSNPCRAIKAIKYEKNTRKPFTHEKREKIKEKCENLRNLALTEFLYATGCRVSEVEKLNIADINFITRELTVQGKGNKHRTVYLTEVAAMHLMNYLNARNDNSPALFVHLKKPYNRLQKGGIEACLRQLGIKSCVNDVMPHRYRHSLATNMLTRGAALQEVQSILGHSDIRVTQVYAHTNQQNVKFAYSKFAA